MKLIIYTNLESIIRTGVFSALKLNTENLSMTPVKGISQKKISNRVDSPQKAIEFDILLCHENAIEPEELILLLNPDIPYAFSLHSSSSNKLFDLYCLFIKVTRKKILYRFDYSDKGSTFNLLRNLNPSNISKKEYDQKLFDYFEIFEKDALTTFKKTLVESMYDPELHPLLNNYSQVTQKTYLWKKLSMQFPKLEAYIEDFIQTEDEKAIPFKILAIEKIINF